MLFKPTNADTLLEIAGEKILPQLRTASGATEESFRLNYLPKLRLFTEYVQELPLQPDGYSQPLGALKFGFTAAWLSLRMADQVMFVQGASHDRRVLDPQYRLAAFHACLASTILLVNHNLIITVAGKPWSYLSAQANLYEAAKGDGYEVAWSRNQRKPSACLGFLALSRFFSAGEWSEYSPAVSADMCNSINPGCAQTTGETSLAKIVRQGMEKARELEVKGRAGTYDVSASPPAVALQLESLMVGATLSIQPAPPQQAPEPSESQPAAPSPKPALSDELTAWASYIRSNRDIQKCLVLNEDKTLKFETRFLQGAGLKAQEVYNWLRNANFIVSQQTEPNKHLVLAAGIARELVVES